MRQVIKYLSLGILPFFAACQTPLLQSQSTSATSSGLVYALPKAQVQIEAARTVITADEISAAEKATTLAGEAVTATKKALTEAKSALKEAEALLAAAATGVKDELTKRRDIADALVRVREAQLEAAKVAAKDADKRLANLRDKEGQFEQTVSVKILAPVPDPKARFVAVLTPSLARDDNIKLVTSNGLLNNSSAESTGQMGSILVNLVSAIAGAQGLKAYTFSSKSAAEPCRPFKLSAVFDPTNLKEVEAVERRLGRSSQGALTLQVQASALPSETALTLPAGDQPAPAESAGGVFYRVPTPVQVRVEDQHSASCSLGSVPSYASLSATVPDSSTRFLLPMLAGQFTKGKLSYEFKDGMPTSFSSEQQSQLAAIARIPVDILKALVEVPASIVKLRVDYESQNAALIEAQTKQMKAELELLKAQQALRDSQGKAAGSELP